MKILRDQNVLKDYYINNYYEKLKIVNWIYLDVVIMSKSLYDIENGRINEFITLNLSIQVTEKPFTSK